MEFKVELSQVTRYASIIEADTAKEAIQKVIDEYMEFDDVESLYTNACIEGGGNVYEASSETDDSQFILEELIKKME